MLVTKVFHFDAAHNLRNYPGKCENLHGHRWRMAVTLKADVGKNGVAFDFLRLADIVNRKVISRLDHTYINKIIKQPSAENIAIWAWKQLRRIPLFEITVWESETSFVVYNGL